jgi:hypothetical protein
MPHACHIHRRLDRPSRRQASDDWPGRRRPWIRRIQILIATFAVAGILAPSAPAGGANPFPYPHPHNADATTTTTDTGSPWDAIAAGLAGVTLLLGVASVSPRRHPRRKPCSLRTRT